MRKRNKWFVDKDYEDKEKLEKENYRFCKHCGSKQKIPSFTDKWLCRDCGYWVFRNSKAEFSFRMSEQLRKKK